MGTVRLSEQIIPKYQQAFEDTKHMHHIITSGRAGTKSSKAAIKAVFKIVSEDDCAVIVIRKFHNKLKKTVFKEILRAIKRLGLNKKDFKITTSPMEIRYRPKGNTIYFTGSDDIDDTKGIIDEEKPIKLVIIDEVTEFFEKGEGEDELQNIEATFVRGNRSEFTMLYLYNPPKNPKAAVTLWKEKMALREDTICIHSDYRDVPVEWLGEKLIESAEQLKAIDEKMYNWLWLGLAVGIDEVIYYMFSEEKHVKALTKTEYDAMQFVGIGVDYGQKNATTYQAFGLSIRDRKIYGIDEYYHSGRESAQKSPSEYARDFKTFVEKIEKQTDKVVTFAYIDPSAKGLAEEIKRVIPRVKIYDADNTVALGIARVSKLLTYATLTLSPTQLHAIEEMYLYQYNEDLIDKGKEVPIKENDHCMDAMRYLIMGFWKYIKSVLPVLKDKTTEGEEKDE